MKRNLLRAAVATISAVLFLSGPVQALSDVSARSAILVDAASGRVLYEKNADEKSLIASTTKIMTGIVAIEQGDLEREFTIPAEATGIEGCSLYLKTGEVLTVRELLYGMLLHSGNDAAVSVAIATSGSVEAFVAQMNEKARELGMEASEFANPNGLDDEHNCSTARDMARLAAYAMENPVFQEIVSTKTITLGQRSFTNHNKLLWRYEGAEGVKTGYTKKSGRILVSAAQQDGRRLICVTINAPNDWEDHTQLLDFGFSGFTLTEVVEQNQVVGSIPILSGQCQSVKLVATREFSYPVAQEEPLEFEICGPRFLFAPLAQGQEIGRLRILVAGKEVGQVPLVCQTSVAEAEEEKTGILERLLK